MATTKCSDCAEDFETERALKVHYRRIHGSTDYPWESTGEFKCPECDFRCDREHGIYVHYGRKHDGSTPWTEQQDGPSCPECGFVAASERALKIHYTKSHDGDEYPWDATNSRAALECEYCGGEYEDWKTRKERSRFCSVKCRNQWQSHSDEWSGADVGGGYETGDLLAELQRVADELEKPPTQRQFRLRSPYSITPYQRAFGGFTAALEAIGLSPDDRAGECPKCEKHFESARGLQGHLTKVHNLRDGRSTPCYDDGSWQTARRNAIQRDGERCQDCGLSRSTHREQVGSDLQVHHKTPYRSFDDPEEANQLDNLVTLCAACHARRELQ